MKTISELYPLLDEPRKVVITTHQKPDPDAMGSSLALYLFLKTFGHEVTVISPTNWASWLNWMTGSDTVLDYESMQDKCKTVLESADWLFCLDFNVLSRTKQLTPLLEEFKGIRIL